MLELRVSESEKVCAAPSGGHWGFQSPLPPAAAISAGLHSQTSLPGTGTLSWVAWPGAGIPAFHGALPQGRYPSQCLTTTLGCGTSAFCLSAPPTSLSMWLFLCILSCKTSTQLDSRWFRTMAVLYYSCSFGCGCARIRVMYTPI